MTIIFVNFCNKYIIYLNIIMDVSNVENFKTEFNRFVTELFYMDNLPFYYYGHREEHNLNVLLYSLSIVKKDKKNIEKYNVIGEQDKNIVISLILFNDIEFIEELINKSSNNYNDIITYELNEFYNYVKRRLYEMETIVIHRKRGFKQRYVNLLNQILEGIKINEIIEDKPIIKKPEELNLNKLITDRIYNMVIDV